MYDGGYSSLALQQEEHAFQRAHEREKPAVDLLATVPVPAGLEACHEDAAATLAPLGYLCWQGEADVVATAAELVEGLRAIGATELAPECVELRLKDRPQALCNVSARVLGERFAAHVMPQLTGGEGGTRYHGAMASGGIGSIAGASLFPFSPQKTRIPLPTG